MGFDDGGVDGDGDSRDGDGDGNDASNKASVLMMGMVIGDRNYS